jgi:DNA-directed RNA polymerase I subunit RPA1
MLTVDDDNDYDHQKRARQVKEQAGYDGPDDEDRDVIRQQDEEEEREFEGRAEGRVNRRADDEDVPQILEEKLVKVDLHDMQERNPNLINFTFDQTGGQWCEIELEVFPSIIV